jgi:hypothetical protein
MVLGKWADMLHPEKRNVKELWRTTMAGHFRGQPPVHVSRTPILAGLDVQQTFREQFTQERLAELGVEFNLADSDWGQLYCMIRRLKE